MKIKTKIPGALLIVSGILFVGCAHHPDVRPGVDGVHRVVIKSDDIDNAQQNALSQAKDFCDEKHKEFAVLDESSKYVGSMNEDDYRTGKVISKTATGLGAAATFFGGKNESAIGGIIGLGGAAADKALGNGDIVEMKFKCL